MNEQRLLKFTPGHESKAARCKRLLAALGDKRIIPAAEVPYFTAAAQREAEGRCQAANREANQ